MGATLAIRLSDVVEIIPKAVSFAPACEDDVITAGVSPPVDVVCVGVTTVTVAAVVLLTRGCVVSITCDCCVEGSGDDISVDVGVFSLSEILVVSALACVLLWENGLSDVGTELSEIVVSMEVVDIGIVVDTSLVIAVDMVELGDAMSGPERFVERGVMVVA